MTDRTKEQLAWEQFANSGRVDAYLRYRALQNRQIIDGKHGKPFSK